ncbi:hypothetical protein C6A50_25135, partial [Escherichia coli]
MTTFTDKELIKEIKERISSLDVRDDIERRAYEIALLSLEVEPDEREAYELFMEKRFGDLVDLPLYFQTSVITYPITSPLPQIFPWRAITQRTMRMPFV